MHSINGFGCHKVPPSAPPAADVDRDGNVLDDHPDEWRVDEWLASEAWAAEWNEVAA